MSLARRFWAPLGVAFGLWAAAPAHGEMTPLFLFGGVDRNHFLGCLNCPKSETFSVWNEAGEYGSPSSPDCIWNRDGVYGSPASPLSPWSESSTTPPLVVDRRGNFYGYFTRDPSHSGGIARARPLRPGATSWERDIRDFLLWFLEDYELIMANLDRVRFNRP